MELCRLCGEQLPQKFRRVIFSPSFKVFKQLSEVLNHSPCENDSLSRYVCYPCFNKLNKLEKIDYDLENKLKALEAEKSSILQELRYKHGLHSSRQVSTSTFKTSTGISSDHNSVSLPTSSKVLATPTKCTTRTKRTIVHTPTPRKFKVQVTPRKIISAAPSSRKRLGHLLLSPLKAKVSYRGQNDQKVRSRIIKEKGLYGVVVGLVRGNKPEVILNKLLKSKGFKEKAFKTITKYVKEECRLLCGKKDASVLRGNSPDCLASVDFQEIATELRKRAPGFSQLLSDIMNTTEPVALVSSAAILLHHRNRNMSLIHHVVGQLLEHGGATDETKDLLAYLGLSVGRSSTQKKHTLLVNRQKEKIEETIIRQVHQSSIRYKMEKTKEMVALLEEKDVTDTCSSSQFTSSSLLQTSQGSAIFHPYFDVKFSTKNENQGIVVAKSSMSYDTVDSYKSSCTAPQTNQLSPLNIFTSIGVIHCPAVSMFSCFEVSPNSGVVQSNSKSTRYYGEKYASRLEAQLQESDIQPAFDVIGDNLDILKSTSSMTKEKQRKSFHWFLLVGLQRRVLVPSLPDDKPKHDILTLPNHSFLPSSEEIKIFESNMVHHILKVLTKHVGCLKPFTECVPKYIAHPFIEQTSKRSTYFILDLMDKNENLHDDMISILEYIHQKYIAHTSGENAEVIERKVFGGDVLTNERAYTAQLAMLNCETNYHKLGGIIHRPEGLHRMMNFLLFIYQEFYKPSSSFEQGTLFQLRNVIHRVDVTGKERVVEAFRAHFAFVEDALDAFILGAAMDVMGLEDINGSPQQFNPNTLSLFSAEDQFSWFKKLAEAIIDKHINLQDSTDLQEMTQASAERDTQDILIKNMFDPMLKQYECTCRKKYKTLGYFKRHLEKEHNWQFPTETVHDTQNTDKIAVWRASFMKTALILRDTCDAYKMGDGDRIFMNAKLEMLCASVAGHTKYQLWLWRMMAYEQAVLSPKKAMEYKWNTTANISGTVDGNIPNDNLVELCVQLIKKKLKEQGANFTLKSAQTTALACQIQEELKENIRQQLCKKAAGKSRTRSDKSADIALMLNEVISGGLFKNIPGRQFENFKNFKGVFEKVNLHKLHLWISKHKEIASYEMI
ncbi:uncharacterized protein LOC134234243 [Saccostrea cucullata]|uniref:uncharacterized protein LOC134234243 n=1 Tax=Saccostrea cuccullata TaxID=36930 RepID=UPI002ED43916